MLDQIGEYIKLIPLFVAKWANFAIQWLQANVGGYVTDFFFDSIGVIGCAVILVLAIICWIILFKSDYDDMFDDDDRTFSAACGWLGLFLYGFLIIWITGMLTHPLNDTGSFLLNTVFEEKALVSFTDKTTTMIPKLPDDSTVTLDNFLCWHDFLVIGAVFVMVKFVFTTIASVLRLRFIKLICFWIITLSFVVGGMMCGGILSRLTEADGFLSTLLSIPVFMGFYFIPVLIVWIPVTAVYCGPVLFVLGLILNPIFSLLGWNFMPMPKFKETTEYTMSFSFLKGYVADQSITRDYTGMITSITSFFTFF